MELAGAVDQGYYVQAGVLWTGDPFKFAFGSYDVVDSYCKERPRIAFVGIIFAGAWGVGRG